MNDELVIANVHSTEAFGTVDGPGIRYVLFLQGCHLKCKYCHNKNSCYSNLGMKIKVDNIIEQVCRNKEYLISSNGGVTASGGEALLQPDAVEYFFKRAKEYNLNTALDTSGAVEITEKIKRVLKYTDLVLLDIKHIDDKKCIELTGKSNKYTLEFAKFLSQNNIPVWIRYVIVPGYTDYKDDLVKLKEFINNLSNVKKVQLLPYHNMGMHKWIELGISYPFNGVREANKEDIKRAKEILDI